MIVRKINDKSFIGIPLTGTMRYGDWYYKIRIKNKESCLMLNQISKFDAKRLTKKIGEVSDELLIDIKKHASDFILDL